jgi:hypothetical protein
VPHDTGGPERQRRVAAILAHVPMHAAWHHAMDDVIRLAARATQDSLSGSRRRSDHKN